MDINDIALYATDLEIVDSIAWAIEDDPESINIGSILESIKQGYLKDLGNKMIEYFEGDQEFESRKVENEKLLNELDSIK